VCITEGSRHFSGRRIRFVSACLKNETVSMMENGLRGRIFSESLRFESHRWDRLAEFGFDVRREEWWYRRNDQRHRRRWWRFDRKTEIEECAAPSAVNFRVLSSREMFKELAPLYWVLQISHISFHSWIFWQFGLFSSYLRKRYSFISALIIYLKLA